MQRGEAHPAVEPAIFGATSAGPTACWNPRRGADGVRPHLEQVGETLSNSKVKSNRAG
jgi:hypothetical protein